MSWLSTTDNEDYSQVITEKVTFSSFWFLKDKFTMGSQTNEIRSLPVSELQGNIQDCYIRLQKSASFS